ncbi:hypothetical protein CARUB_v10015631mg [Capsella rubella]|uniref:F-box domain-containing protein n=1 Tax=Capsella rubella TaxID=81985 RepID=R0HRF0_9BRAS|nr:hypothetical protein CARUB_v10015631mg [Capsella rubella]
MNGEEPMTLMMLPNDLILNCLARVPRLYYHTLSLVSKRLRSLLASTELYQTRILLGWTEKQCFTLCRKPNSSKNVLVPITSPNSATYDSDCAKVGYNIYTRGGGGCKNLDATNWMEVFDTITQNWEFELYGAYKLSKGKGRWREADLAMDMCWSLSSSLCVIENVLYSCSDGSIGYYNPDEKYWTSVKGLESLFGSRYECYGAAQVTDYGGKLAVLWEEDVYTYEYEYSLHKKLVWCAVVALERHQ